MVNLVIWATNSGFTLAALSFTVLQTITNNILDQLPVSKEQMND
jgi:hypothetical protein